MKVVALLPMKENSERVPNKNFRVLGHKPLFYWVLDSLLRSDYVDNVVINTDARYILDNADLRSNEKIVIRSRPEKICGDLVSMNLVIENDLQNVEGDIFFQTHTTNPFLSTRVIDAAISTFKGHLVTEEYDSIFSVTKIQERMYSSSGGPINHDPLNLVRTQDLDPIYIENSNFYCFTPGSFASAGARIGKKPFLFELDSVESIDIDNPDDWRLAEVIAQSDMLRDRPI